MLNAVLAIDKNNTLAHIYQKEIAERNAAKKAETSGSFLPKRKEKDIDKKPLSGNDVILPRSSYKEPSNGAITIINVLAGVVIGAALIWFLIVRQGIRDLHRIIRKVFRSIVSSYLLVMWN